MPKKLLIALLFLSLIFFLLTPTKGDVSFLLFYICFGLMIISNYIYFKGKNKSNYLDFDTIFILVFCLVGFSTTFFYDDNLIFNALFLNFPVDEQFINKGNLLFLIGLQSYMIGSLVPIKNIKSVKNPSVIKTNFLVTFVFLLVISFFAFGGINYYRAGYNDNIDAGSGNIAKYILLLLVTSSMALIGTEFYNKKLKENYNISWITFSTLFFLICILLMVGNRTAASQILLPIICLYALFFKKISFKKVMIFVFGGILLMWVIQHTRTGDESFKLTNPIMLILDLTIPMRSTYSAFDYVDNNGYTYGSAWIIDTSGIFPLLPSLIQNSFPELKPGSASLLTDYSLDILNTPEEFRIGLGTTIIADIFVSFGLIGVTILMFFLGYYVNKWYTESFFMDYYSIIILCAMLGNAIFIVRAGVLHPLRFVIWALVFAWFNRIIHMKWKR